MPPMIMAEEESCINFQEMPKKIKIWNSRQIIWHQKILQSEKNGENKREEQKFASLLGNDISGAGPGLSKTIISIRNTEER